MTPAPSTRPLEAADLGRVVGIDGTTSGRSRRGYYAKRFAFMEEDRGAVVALGAERDGQLVGFAFARFLDGEFGGETPAGVLDAIGVAPAAQGGGLGKELLRGIEEALARRGARQVRTQADWTDVDMVGFFSRQGFGLSGRIVLERTPATRLADEEEEDELPVRSMEERDVPAIVRLDRRITGRDRAAYYRRKAAEALRHGGVRVSLVAEVDGAFAGFLMARVDYGEFGRTDPIAVLDTIGVHPDFARRRVGRSLLEQLLRNLGSLRVERVLTELDLSQRDLLAFFARTGFGPSQRLSLEKAIPAPEQGDA
jgi:ribosomal protein S18 acetylase RimI-like enzyme